jgi:hypothetical protein
MPISNENIPLIVIGVILVMLVLVYVMYPLYFEKYVLMNIPEYRLLKNVLNESKKTLDLTDVSIKEYKKRVEGTDAENQSNKLQIAELETQITSLKEELVEFTGLIATLREQLEESNGRVHELTEINDAATKRMREMNDLIIAEFELPDKELVKRIQATRDSLLVLFGSSKDVICDNKSKALAYITNEARNIRLGNSPQITGICSAMEEHKATLRRQKESVLSDDQIAPISSDLSSLFDNIESIISYVIQNKFCDENLGFKVDAFEKYVKDLINGMCESDDWKKITGKQLDYILTKPFTYLPE